MKLSEIFSQLEHGELAQLAISGEGMGISEIDYPAIINHINLGLTELYTRFPLLVQEVIVQQYEQINTYHLDSKYAKSNLLSPQPIKYIDDSIYEPFQDNVLKIESVQDEDGQELFLNDENQYWSIYTPSYRSVQIPYPEDENAMLIKYRADHVRIPSKNINPEEIEVDIPLTLVYSLMLFIAARVHSVSPSLEGMNLGNSYLGKFEASIIQAERQNMFNKANPSNFKLKNAGWL